jgi:Arc/MetJ family transcription regulator
MRTNIVLDEELVKQARQLTGIKTKKELIHEALRVMIRLRQQSQVRSLRGKLHWEGDLEEQRQSRFPEDEP